MRLDELLDPNKAVYFYRQRRGQTGSQLPPVAAELHWTSNCNYDCFHCSYGSRRKTKSYLTKDVISHLVEDLIAMQCQAVYLSGGGEPTVMPKWDEYAGKLIDNGVEVALITNQIAIKPKSYEVVRKMNYVAVSVYSTYENRYKKITGSRFFEEQFLLPEKIKTSDSDVIVGARCVISEINYDEVYEIYQAAINSGFDYIIFIPVVDYEGRNVELSRQWAEQVSADIKEKLELYDVNRTNVTSLVSKQVSHYDRKDYRDKLPVNSPEGCKAIQVRTGVFINYDGGVYLCQPDIGDKKLEIGNLFEDRFSEIWNSEQHLQVIGELDQRYNKGRCEKCRSIGFTHCMYEEDAKMLTGIEFKNPDPFL